MGTDLIKAVLDGQAGLDDCHAGMRVALRGVMVKALVDLMHLKSSAQVGFAWPPSTQMTHFFESGFESGFGLDRGQARLLYYQE